MAEEPNSDGSGSVLADLPHPDDPADSGSPTRRPFPNPDLISNASALAVTGDRASWEASLNVDVMGAVRLVEAVLPMMKAEGGGSILQEIADAAVWLVSPRAGWVNGAALIVDGGQSKAIR